VSVVVAGTFRIPVENLPALRPHLRAVVEATRAEDGCLVYSYGEDMLEPGLIRVFEVWRDQAAVEAHFAAPHMKAWQSARAALGFSNRDIRAYETSSERPL
jgi:quinol monooxygenase YgiN